MADSPDFHENLNRAQIIETGSNRAFGLVFTVVFLVLALLPLIGGGTLIWSLAAIATFFLLAALLTPHLLAPLNKAWQKFGLALHTIINPLVMGILFYVTVTPTGLIMRALGKVPLHLNFNPDAESYWIERNPPGPEPGSMNRQF
ncbi:MAG: SxtJ family membrane protein [Pseudomonadota bacterium]|nr:SxtJ family membrane protein [Pseudomonadota bacterium]